MSALAPTLQSFFTSYLVGQRGASKHTITAYRDTMRLLLAYTHERTQIQPSDLDISVLDTELITAFLTMLEQRRGNSIRTRNARLAAIHSLTVTPRGVTPSTPTSSRASSRSPRRTTIRRSSPTSTQPRSTRCSKAPTAPPGPAGETT